MSNKIIQIIPAIDWIALWDGSEKWIDHIPCFGLTSNGEVHALSIDQKDGSLITYADIISKLPKHIKINIQNRYQSIVHFAKIEKVKEELRNKVKQ